MFLNGYPVADDYRYDFVLNDYLNTLLLIEIILTIIHYMVVFYHYYVNVWVIEFRPTDYMEN